MLPRIWSAICELGEIRYKFGFKCRKGFQLVDTSDFGISLLTITLTVKNFNKNIQYCGFILQIKINHFCCKSTFKCKQIGKILGWSLSWKSSYVYSVFFTFFLRLSRYITRLCWKLDYNFFKFINHNFTVWRQNYFF